jgi:N-acetylglutamate synthase-like GNAT family acetyltransferase
MRDPVAVLFRKARRDDLRAILALLNDGKVGNILERIEDPLPEVYDDAFSAIEADPNQLLLVGQIDGRIVASLQLTFIPGIANRGAWRARSRPFASRATCAGGRSARR